MPRIQFQFAIVPVAADAPKKVTSRTLDYSIGASAPIKLPVSINDSVSDPVIANVGDEVRYALTDTNKYGSTSSPTGTWIAELPSAPDAPSTPTIINVIELPDDQQ